MKVSTKGRYGLRLMIELAKLPNKKNMSVKEIAERQNISVKYLEQIVTPLSKAGLVKSVRGAMGGYSLNKDAKLITVTDILNATEGTAFLVECTENDNFCERKENCPAGYVWKEIRNAIEGVTDKITLSELVERQL